MRRRKKISEYLSGLIETRVGKIQVLDATIGEGQASKCLIIEGSGFMRGDLIKMK